MAVDNVESSPSMLERYMLEAVICVEKMMKRGINVKIRTKYRTPSLNLSPNATGPVIAPVALILKKNLQKQVLNTMQPRLLPQIPQRAAAPVEYPVPADPVVVDAAIKSPNSIVVTANKGIDPSAIKNFLMLLLFPALHFNKTPKRGVIVKYKTTITKVIIYPPASMQTSNIAYHVLELTRGHSSAYRQKRTIKS